MLAISGTLFAGDDATMSAMPWREPVKPAGSGVKLTYDDFVLFPDDGKRHELIDGEHYVTPSPNMRHQLICSDVFGSIWSYLQTKPGGLVLHAPSDVVLSHFDVVEPDILYISQETAARVVTPQNVRGAPDLVIEVASPGTRRRDATVKYDLYERQGVAEYWIVDPYANVVRVYRSEEGRFKAAIELSRDAGDVLTTPLLPGYELALTRLFGE